mmetsp:Transcript_2063/g.5431  ORF Transcript_2063/g.5431 Transcript_2063/m.5431 type:complete len:214 (-) Transcript_2063:983-1624(-)
MRRLAVGTGWTPTRCCTSSARWPRHGTSRRCSAAAASCGRSPPAMSYGCHCCRRTSVSTCSLRRRCADDKRTRHCMWRAARGIPFDTMHSTQTAASTTTTLCTGRTTCSLQTRGEHTAARCRQTSTRSPCCRARAAKQTQRTRRRTAPSSSTASSRRPCSYLRGTRWRGCRCGSQTCRAASATRWRPRCGRRCSVRYTTGARQASSATSSHCS